MIDISGETRDGCDLERRRPHFRLKGRQALPADRPTSQKRHRPAKVRHWRWTPTHGGPMLKRRFAGADHVVLVSLAMMNQGARQLVAVMLLLAEHHHVPM